MTKREQAAEITRELIDNDNRLYAGEITPVEHGMKIKAIYDLYKPDLNVWRKACKDKALQTDGIYLPMRDC